MVAGIVNRREGQRVLAVALPLAVVGQLLRRHLEAEIDDKVFRHGLLIFDGNRHRHVFREVERGLRLLKLCDHREFRAREDGLVAVQYRDEVGELRLALGVGRPARHLHRDVQLHVDAFSVDIAEAGDRLHLGPEQHVARSARTARLETDELAGTVEDRRLRADVR